MRGKAGQVGSKKYKPIPHPHNLCEVGKTHVGRSEEGRVKRGRAKLPSLNAILNQTTSSRRERR